MDGKNETDKIDDEMLPGFRFHPTDEELVGFYLKKKIQQRSLPIELIKQVDIYKYDPWDLPNLASTGEKEWYFYCPRDRKYRNSARPNRVTGAGFWKATGTDRPIYSSDGTKCIGLKKSLVFYRGRAAKGMKTDWMMHEFRLPSIPDSGPPKKLLDKNLPPNDSWAICRIFKKTNSMAQRALSHSWIFPENSASDMFSQGTHSQFSPDNRSCTAETGSGNQLCHTNELRLASADSFSALDIPTFRSINPTICKLSPYSISQGNFPKGFMFSPPEMSVPISNCTTDVASMLFNLSPDLLGDVSTSSERIEFGGPHQPFNSFPMNSPQDMQGCIGTEDDDASLRKNYSPAEVNNQWGNIRSTGFPFSLPPSTPVDAWKLNLPWDTPPCPSEMSGTYSTSVIPSHSDSSL